MLKIVQERLGHADPATTATDLPARDRARERRGEGRAGAPDRRGDGFCRSVSRKIRNLLAT